MLFRSSEIVAGAMQDHGRARIVGEESFGKGLVQTVYRLRGGTGLTLTTAHYFTPAGRSIQRSWGEGALYDYLITRRQGGELGKGPGAGGIQPDFPVAARVESTAERDACFEFARLLTAGLFPELTSFHIRKAESGHRFRGTEYQITARVWHQFHQFLGEHPEWQVDEEGPARRSIEQRIRAEVISAAYGIEVAEELLMDEDPQVLAAIECLERLGQSFLLSP